MLLPSVGISVVGDTDELLFVLASVEINMEYILRIIVNNFYIFST